MSRWWFLCAVALACIGELARAQSNSEVTVVTDSQLFDAICSQKYRVIWLGASLSLREEHWPANCSAPVRLQTNLTLSGPLDAPIQYTVDFNFMARKVRFFGGSSDTKSLSSSKSGRHRGWLTTRVGELCTASSQGDSKGVRV